MGDWVKLDRESGEGGDAVICEMLARKSALIRKEAGLGIQGQVIAANIDYVFICMSLNQDYNLKRLDRYIAVSSCPGIIPIVVLTKADLNQEAESMPGGGHAPQPSDSGNPVFGQAGCWL